MLSPYVGVNSLVRDRAGDAFNEPVNRLEELDGRRGAGFDAYLAGLVLDRLAGESQVRVRGRHLGLGRGNLVLDVLRHLAAERRQVNDAVLEPEASNRRLVRLAHDLSHEVGEELGPVPYGGGQPTRGREL